MSIGLGYSIDYYYRRLSEQVFVFENINFTASLHIFNFTISAGATRTFDLTIIDDNIAEYYYYHECIYITLLVYESDGGTDYCDSYNDGKTDD